MSLPFAIRPLRPAEPATAMAVWALHEAAHRQEESWLGQPLPRPWADSMALARETRQLLGAFDAEGVLTGLLLAEVGARGPHIARLAVDPARQGEGWGWRLVNHLVAAAHEVTADTASANLAALAVYRRAGFHETGRHLLPQGLELVHLCYRRDRQGQHLPLLALDGDGWVSGARHLPSPNCDDFPDGSLPTLLIVHNISLPPSRYGGDAVERLFTNRLDPQAHPYFAAISHLRVSSHFFIRRDGTLVQCVPVRRRAWHAGVSCFGGRERCNDFALGVEMEGCDFEPFTEAQYCMLARLGTLLRRALPLAAITGHEHVAPGRKTDPGPFFDWKRAAHDTGLPFVAA